MLPPLGTDLRALRLLIHLILNPFMKRLLFWSGVYKEENRGPEKLNNRSQKPKPWLICDKSKTVSLVSKFCFTPHPEFNCSFHQGLPLTPPPLIPEWSPYLQPHCSSHHHHCIAVNAFNWVHNDSHGSHYPKFINDYLYAHGTKFQPAENRSQHAP